MASSSFYCRCVVFITDDLSLSGRSIEVILGREPAATTFSVHEGLISASSQFFKTTMKECWKEGQQGSVRLEDQSADIFQLYLHWLYKGTLPVRIDKPGAEGNEEYLQLAKAYTLGDELIDGDFQDAIIDAIVDKCNSKASDGQSWFPVGAVVQQIYRHTLKSSKARRLLTDLYITHGSGGWLRVMKQDEIPAEFLFDLAIGFLDRERYDPTTKSTLCEYHQHGPEHGLCYRARLP